jgi:DNA repair exonuclease SbcCD ATPase subunit
VEFLKKLLGDDLYSQLETKINEYNSTKTDKEKQIKLADIGSGNYVEKNEYEALNGQLNGKQTELETANALIEDLKKGNKSNDDLQSKISEYEEQVADLRTQLEETKLKSAVKVALMSENAVDVDYLTFKLNESGETIELDENGNIKDWQDKISNLKTKFPKMFESGDSGGYKILGDNRLPNGGGETVLTRNDILKKPYAERAALYSENPDAYNEAMSK